MNPSEFIRDMPVFVLGVGKGKLVGISRDQLGRVALDSGAYGSFELHRIAPIAKIQPPTASVQDATLPAILLFANL